MLQKPDVHTENRLRTADVIEHGIPGIEFDMGEWCGTVCCVAGHAAILAGYSGENLDQVRKTAERWLGLSYAQGEALFLPWGYGNSTRVQAARVVRHLAITGEVDWTKADGP